MQFTTVRNLIKALLTKRKLTGNFRLKRGNFKARSETDDVPTEVMKESNGILVEKKTVDNKSEGWERRDIGRSDLPGRADENEKKT